MSDATIVYLVLLAVVALFIWNKVPVEVVAVGSALTLAATGVLTLDQALAGFGDTTVLFIAALFVVSEGIDSTGVTTWAGQQLIDRAGASRTRLIILMMLLVALLTAVISVNGAVAALLPMVVVIALRVGRAPSSLLMPLAFGAHAGSLLALTGTPVHILVSDAAIEAGEAGFGYFEFGLVGVPVVIGAIAIVVFFGTRLLPRAGCRVDPSRSQRPRPDPHRSVLPGRVGGAARGSGRLAAGRTSRHRRSISTHSPTSPWSESRESMVFPFLRTHRSEWAMSSPPVARPTSSIVSPKPTSWRTCRERPAGS